MQPHGPWQIVSSREVYKDPWLNVRRDEVIRPDGLPGSHCLVHLKPGVSVLPLDAERHVYLTQEFHYAVGRDTLEVVSGGREPGEPAQLSAQRELAEELGITATDWTDLGSVDPITSVVNSPVQMFLAQGLSFGRATLEGTEKIVARKLSLDEAIAMVCDGRITHAPSCVLLLRAERWLLGRAARP